MQIFVSFHHTDICSIIKKLEIILKVSSKFSLHPLIFCSRTIYESIRYIAHFFYFKVL